MQNQNINRRELLTATGIAAAVVAVSGVSALAADATAEQVRSPGVPQKMEYGKLYVITDEKGAVIGTARVGKEAQEGGPIPGRPTPAKGQKLHEVEWTADLEKLETAADLHRAVARMIK